jgi:hypothetical protein
MSRENGNAYAFGKFTSCAARLPGVCARDAASKAIFKKLL